MQKGVIEYRIVDDDEDDFELTKIAISCMQFVFKLFQFHAASG